MPYGEWSMPPIVQIGKQNNRHNGLLLNILWIIIIVFVFGEFNTNYLKSYIIQKFVSF